MKDKEILEQNGWFIECLSPFEIKHIDGDIATGQAARIIINSFKKEFNPNKIISFTYANWKSDDTAKVSDEKVVPEHIWFGSTDSNEEERWLLNAIDIEKQINRDYSINDIVKFIK